MRRYELSYWEREQFFKNLDFLIVGGGIVGLTAAISIKEKHPTAKVSIIDRGVLPIGASTRNAGFACFGSITELLDDLSNSTEEIMLELLENRYAGLALLRKNYGDQAIGYQQYGGYEIFRATEKHIFDQCESKIESLNQLLKDITTIPDTFILPSKTTTNFGFNNIAAMIWNQAEGQLNTGMLMATLMRRARALDVFFMGGITVDSWNETNSEVVISTTQNWEITTRKLLIATNGFADQLVPGIEVQPARNQVLVTNPIPGLKVKGTFHYHQGYYYFRNIDGRILLGGGRNLDKTGETTNELGAHDRIRKSLVKLLEDVIIPGINYSIDQWWSGIMGVGMQKTPIVKQVGDKTVAAVRLGGMGVALGTSVGQKGATMLMDS